MNGILNLINADLIFWNEDYVGKSILNIFSNKLS